MNYILNLLRREPTSYGKWFSRFEQNDVISCPYYVRLRPEISLHLYKHKPYSVIWSSTNNLTYALQIISAFHRYIIIKVDNSRINKNIDI